MVIFFTVLAIVITYAIWISLREIRKDIDSWSVINFSIQTDPSVVLVRVVDRHGKYKNFAYRLYSENPYWVSIKDGRVQGRVPYVKELRLYALLIRVVIPNSDKQFANKLNAAIKSFTIS